MRQELNIFFNALLFYTRIPVPKTLEFSDDNQRKAFRYYPLMGIIVGGIGSVCFIVASYLLPSTIAIVIALACMMLITGCLHEDGFSDVFDGFGGGSSKEAILRIMKDSHIGVYGTVALILLLLLKFVSNSEIPVAELPIVWIATHSVSRIYPILLINSSSYVREGPSKAQHTRQRVDRFSVAIAIATGIVPLLLLPYLMSVIFIPLSVLLFFGYRYYLHKRIGGFTGDTLGALQQFVEILFYLTYIAMMGL